MGAPAMLEALGLLTPLMTEQGLARLGRPVTPKRRLGARTTPYRLEPQTRRCEPGGRRQVASLRLRASLAMILVGAPPAGGQKHIAQGKKPPDAVMSCCVAGRAMRGPKGDKMDNRGVVFGGLLIAPGERSSSSLRARREREGRRARWKRHGRKRYPEALRDRAVRLTRSCPR